MSICVMCLYAHRYNGIRETTEERNVMETEAAWKKYDDKALAELEAICADYIQFISEHPPAVLC